MNIDRVKQKLTTSKFTIPEQSFRVECASLRPFTRYFVIFDKQDFTQFCVQDGKRITEPLISDSYGKLNFTFHWTRMNESAIANNRTFSKLFDSDTGNKILVVRDRAGTSVVRKTFYFTNNTPDILFTRYTKSSNIVLT